MRKSPNVMMRNTYLNLFNYNFCIDVVSFTVEIFSQILWMTQLFVANLQLTFIAHLCNNVIPVLTVVLYYLIVIPLKSGSKVPTNTAAKPIFNVFTDELLLTPLDLDCQNQQHFGGFQVLQVCTLSSAATTEEHWCRVLFPQRSQAATRYSLLYRALVRGGNIRLHALYLSLSDERVQCTDQQWGIRAALNCVDPC